jgi:hypothetical protein
VSTHTCRYSAYLGVFTCEDEYGSWWPLLQYIIVKQDDESFEWVFRHLLKILGIEDAGQGAKGVIDVIATDGDPAMANAVESVLRISHLLCQWHIVERNLHPNMWRFCQGMCSCT